MFSFLRIVKQKKILEWSEIFWNFLIFKNHKVNWDPPWRISTHRDFDSLGGPLLPLGKNLFFQNTVMGHIKKINTLLDILLNGPLLHLFVMIFEKHCYILFVETLLLKNKPLAKIHKKTWSLKAFSVLLKHGLLKFMYSEKATKFCEISTYFCLYVL